MIELGKVLARVVVIACFALGCGSSTTREFGGETNWLRACVADDDCDAETSCICGLCSKTCSDAAECGDGLACQPKESTLVYTACGTLAEAGMCAPECTEDDDCGAGQRCAQGACAPTARAMSEPRQPDAFVLGAVAPSSDCVYASDSPIYPIGQYDVNPGFTSEMNCARGYRVTLRVASTESEILQLLGATVTLMNRDHEPIVFDEGGPDAINPFTYDGTATFLSAAEGTPATGLFTIEAIRRSHAATLADERFIGGQILAEVQLHARDAADNPLDLRPFIYPIDLCDGCLSLCEQADIRDQMRIPEDVIGDACADNAGQDGRVCIDPGC